MGALCEGGWLILVGADRAQVTILRHLRLGPKLVCGETGALNDCWVTARSSQWSGHSNRTVELGPRNSAFKWDHVVMSPKLRRRA